MTSSSSNFEPWPEVDELLKLDSTNPERIVRILGGLEVDPDIDDREHVFDASTLLAQAVIGRAKSKYETWDEVVQLIEDDNRSGLASALWVGLSSQPAARYRTLDQWRRSVEAGIRSDAAIVTAQEPVDRSKMMLTVLGLVGVGLLGWFAFNFTFNSDGDSDTDISSAGSADGDTITTAVAAPTVDEPPVGASSETESTDTNSDPCQAVGPLGPLFVDQVTDGAIVIGWEPSPDAVNITLDGGFVDTVPADANQYVIEHRPLLPSPLPSATDFVIEIMPEGGDPSSVCASTVDEPVEALIGVYAPTGVTVIDQTPNSLTISWDLRPGADLHNLYVDRSYVTYGDGQGSTSIGDENEFTLFDLEPATTYEIGVRRIEGFNQSGMTIVTVTTPAG